GSSGQPVAYIRHSANSANKLGSRSLPSETPPDMLLQAVARLQWISFTRFSYTAAIRPAARRNRRRS
ncbi:hypothetical protein QNM99_26125, partial [Pseudomonas sp. PCH446]